MEVDRRELADAYVYLLGRMLVIRQEHMDRAGKAFAYNRIKYNPLGSADFVNPNFDVAYLEAWFAVDNRNAVLLQVPEVKGRYYTAQILDEWGEVIANINERTLPSKPFGTFALVKPGSTAKVPKGAGRIELHSGKAKMLARVELKGDPDGALKLQKQFRVRTTGTIKVARPPAIAMFDNQKLIGAEIFDGVDAILASALDVAPNAATMQQQVRAVAQQVAASKANRAEADALLCKEIIPEFQEYVMTRSAPYRDHWVGGSRTGTYNGNFWLRTTVNFAGIWANVAEEVLYFAATRDNTETTLNGSNSYVMHFAADKLPGTVVNAYWSVILVGVPDYRVVENPLKRYNFNSHSPLKSEADGSLKLGFGTKPPAGVPESNWLPAPHGKPFSLTFRTYVPKPSVIEGKWSPPALSKA